MAGVPSNRTDLQGHVSFKTRCAAKKDGRRVGGDYPRANLAALKHLLDLAVNKELTRTNYAKDLRPLIVDEVAADEKTIPFNLDQLVVFFNSAYYRGCADGTGAPYRRADKSWRFWFPVVASSAEWPEGDFSNARQ